MVLFESNTFGSSSTLEKGGGVTGLLFRFGRPGQLASINGSDIGTDKELGGVSATTLVDVGGIGGVKFLETDFIISGDERTLVVILLHDGVTTFVTHVLLPPSNDNDAEPNELLCSTE